MLVAAVCGRVARPVLRRLAGFGGRGRLTTAPGFPTVFAALSPHGPISRSTPPLPLNCQRRQACPVAAPSRLSHRRQRATIPAALPQNVSQREYRDGHPVDLGDAWVLRKGDKVARCSLVTHQLVSSCD